MTKKTLTPRQEKFIVLYLKLGNATASAIGAGYAERSAAQTGYDLLRNPQIAARIAKPLQQVAERAELSAVRVLEEMRRLAFADIRPFFNADGSPKPISEWTEEMGSQCSSVEVVLKNARAGDGVIDEVLKLRLHQKQGPLEMLGKHFKLLTDVVQVIDSEKLIERLERGRQRYAKVIASIPVAERASGRRTGKRSTNGPPQALPAHIEDPQNR